MRLVSDIVFPKLLASEQGTDPTVPAAGQRKLYAKADGFYEIDSAGVVTGPLGSSGGGGAGPAFTSRVAIATPTGVVLPTGTPATASSAQARALLVNIPGPMRLRALRLGVATAGAGNITWGLFDYATDPTAATKIAGGAATPGGTGYREIPATGGPINIDPGAYALIVQNPSTGPSSLLQTAALSAAPGVFKVDTSYTWSDTPNLTAAGWSDATATFACFLEGDLDVAGTPW